MNRLLEKRRTGAWEREDRTDSTNRTDRVGEKDNIEAEHHRRKAEERLLNAKKRQINGQQRQRQLVL